MFIPESIDLSFSNIQKHLPELRKLEILDFGVKEPFTPGEWVLNYLQSAKHLMELSFRTAEFPDISLNDFYERALEIIKKRENKLPLKIYHQGQTIVRENNLKIFYSAYTPPHFLLKPIIPQ